MHRFVLGAVASLCAAGTFAGAGAGSISPVSGQFVSSEPRDLDLSRLGHPATGVDVRAAVQSTRSRFGFAGQFDPHLGTTFLWTPARERTLAAPLGASPVHPSDAVGRAHLRSQARALGLTDQAIAQARLHDLHVSPLGAVVYRYAQRQDGLEVFNRQLNVVTDAQGRLVAVSGYFAPQGQAGAVATFKLPAAQAVQHAFRALGGTGAIGLTAIGSKDGYQRFQATGAQSSDLQPTGQPRARKVLFPLDGAMLPAWYVEVQGSTRDAARQAAHGYVISATDGRVLFCHDLVDHDSAQPVSKPNPNAYVYRVLASIDNKRPLDSPLGNAAQPFRQADPTIPDPRVMVNSHLIKIVTDEKGAIHDPWMQPGATTTSGNNVVSYLDLGGADGFDAGDLAPTLTGPNTFDYPVAGDGDTKALPNQNGAAVMLFYVNNWLHDFWYPHGFNEASGNAQRSNYGRGGVEGDPVLAEGQDFSGRNNANMFTPADGGSPRMQMYLWDGLRDASVAITAPAELAGPLVFGTAAFGAMAFDVTAPVVAYNDGVAPGGDACTPAINGAALAGKLALIDRGTCAFTVKVKNAQDAGAVGAVIVNNAPGTPPAMGGTDTTITIGSMSISQDDGNRIKASPSQVTMNLRRALVPDLDGTIDMDIIAHEYFHHVSNRLVGNAAGLSNNQGRGMGEGWSDFNTLLVTIRDADTKAPNNDHWQGAYAVGGYVSGSNYFGIRRTPYSTDMAKDPLTFKHIQNGVPLPVGAPIAFGQDGASNAEVHNTGEIWCNVLWEAYAGFLNDPRYNTKTARDRVQDYIVAGLKATPNAPTILEARDAILAVADASNDADFTIWATAFAKRGMGVGAVGPDRNSNTNIGVTESYVVAVPTP